MSACPARYILGCAKKSDVIDHFSSWLSTVITQSAGGIDHTVDNSPRNGHSQFGLQLHA